MKNESQHKKAILSALAVSFLMSGGVALATPSNDNGATSQLFHLSEVRGQAQMVADSDSKCGSTKCSTQKTTDSKCSTQKSGDSKCSTQKSGDSKCSTQKAPDTKCGATQCGATKSGQ